MPVRTVGASAVRPLASVARRAGALPRRVWVSARSLPQRLSVRARQLLSASGEAARLLTEMLLLSARSARESLRSTVLLRRLYVRRAAVIYSTGCAALNGEERRFQQARAELRLLDELITAASSQTTLPYTAEDSAAAAPAELPTEAPADVPTEESVLMPRATVRVPALRQSQM